MIIIGLIVHGKWSAWIISGFIVHGKWSALIIIGFIVHGKWSALIIIGLQFTVNGVPGHHGESVHKRVAREYRDEIAPAPTRILPLAEIIAMEILETIGFAWNAHVQVQKK